MSAATASGPRPAGAPDGSGVGRVRVLVADDHPPFRRGLAFALGRDDGIEVVAEAQDGEEALRLIDELRPGVAVVDDQMPGLTGADVCAALSARADRPATAALLLSAFEHVELVWTAVSAGAVGYMGKGARAQELGAAVVSVARGGVAYTERGTAGFAEALARRCIGG